MTHVYDNNELVYMLMIYGTVLKMQLLHLGYLVKAFPYHATDNMDSLINFPRKLFAYALLHMTELIV